MSAAVDAGDAPADHEAEEPRAGRGDQPRLGRGDQPVDHGVRGRRALRAAARRSRREQAPRRPEPTTRRPSTAGAVVRRPTRGIRQQPAELVHPRKLVTEEVGPQRGRQCLDRAWAPSSSTSPRATRTRRTCWGQGRQPRRDDQPRAAGPARVHDHHRGLPGLPRRGRRAGRAGRRGHRAPRGPREDDGPPARRRRRPAAGQRPLGREVLDARDDGDGPQRRAQRRVRGRAGAAERGRAVRPGLLPPAAPDVRRAPCSASTPSCSPTRSTRSRSKRGVEADLDLDADDLQGARRDVQGICPASTPAGTSRRTRASSSTSPSAPSSTPGTPTGPGSTAARSGSPRTSAPRSTCRRWCSATAAWTPAPASLHPRPRQRRARASTATTCRTRRARTSSPASATPSPLADLEEIDKASYDELLEIMSTLEKHYRDMCDIEFTVESGKLWMLQTRVGKRTAEAAFRIAVHMVDEGLIDLDEALRRVTGAQLAQLMFPRFDDEGRAHAARQGHERLARRGRRQGGVRLGHRRRVGRARRGRDPGPQGDQPRRPARHGRRPGHPHQPRRQDLARRRRRPRHGPHLRVRRRGARRRHPRGRVHACAAARPSPRAT